ncbi:MAG: ParB N-terminal domain-containing protein [Phycisphaerae bacterium]|nr:ParB N-terminal domain-containing protein [Phycisphaerae bacterium]
MAEHPEDWTRVELTGLHDHLIRTSVKGDDRFREMSSAAKTDYIREHFRDREYSEDNWYLARLPLADLVAAHPEFRSEIPLTKEETYVSQWDAIRPTLAEHWVLPYDVCTGNTCPPIVAREDDRKGLYRVWDGQRRVLSCLWHGLDDIDAYVYVEPSAADVKSD